ncbi:MAG: hypothetical protein KGD67_13065, partial [Candidatus Lokiarchaeota archaeon]|nr:hypothetical protein [Candidatus Lokiarchaeota archaeon]
MIRSSLKSRKIDKNAISHVSKSYFVNYQGFKLKDLFRKVFVLIYNLSRYNRRYDFFTKEELKKCAGCIPVKRRKKELKFPNGFKPKSITDEDVMQDEVSRKEKVGLGIQTWDGFVGSYR